MVVEVASVLVLRLVGGFLPSENYLSNVTNLTHHGLRLGVSRWCSSAHQEVNNSSRSSGRLRLLARWVSIEYCRKEKISLFGKMCNLRLSNFDFSQPGQQQMAGIQRVVINQPGLRPGQPGAQITVPLSTLQVLLQLQNVSTFPWEEVSTIILTCAGTSGWPGNSHWPTWPPLG